MPSGRHTSSPFDQHPFTKFHWIIEDTAISNTPPYLEKNKTKFQVASQHPTSQLPRVGMWELWVGWLCWHSPTNRIGELQPMIWELSRHVDVSANRIFGTVTVMPAPDFVRTGQVRPLPQKINTRCNILYGTTLFCMVFAHPLTSQASEETMEVFEEHMV